MNVSGKGTYQDHGYLEYLGSEYDDGVEVQGYKVNKAGTYYIPVLDLNGNNYDAIYGISTQFEADKDTVAPNKPAVNKVDNNDKVITGKAEASRFNCNINHLDYLLCIIRVVSIINILAWDATLIVTSGKEKVEKFDISKLGN
ncbi:hypothetical protein [Priestia megaterium]|uniref:hypothetical protein n=1 Tax=Priestia megaterium TaxID=1404 RepID=UPI001F49887F|nr:hypothetical protein [Priestia megaterium]MED3866220.1 hypothetical protein [Priestia megaterium]MED4097822.1 hypothetical protein [Priestia megaterium]MED4141892.1 hypothetical protein [Priestia megaterium]MED4169330.1 hypothetical protein [Priestia megaterium]MED4199837.1 hypothetical protein [Priestia megaterium]